MILQQAAPASTGAPTSWPSGPLRWAVAVLVLLGLGMAAVLNASTGPEGRIAKNHSTGDHAYGGGLRANEPLWGVEHWTLWIQLLSLAGSTIVITTFAVLSWRRRAMHPAVPVVIALFGVSLLDPFANWCSSAAMNPQLLHYPVDWPYANISPTVQPLVNNLVYPYLFLFPALFVVGAWKRWLRRDPEGAGWVRRHPLSAVFGFSFLISLPVNLVVVDMFMVRVEYWTYTQIPSWAAVRGGSSWQYPWTDPLTLSLVTGATAVFLWRDADGRSLANRIADRLRPLRSRRLLGEVLVASLFLSLSYMAYNGLWATFRLTDSGDQLARPWPYQDTKVYDPTGHYRSAGVPGPYFAGVWP